MDMNQWIMELKCSRVKKALPILSFPGVQIIGKTVDQLIRDAGLQAECMKAIADKYPTLAAVSLMDLSVEAECFGSTVRFSEDEVPTVVGSIVSTPEDVAQLQVPGLDKGRAAVFIEAIRKAKEQITDRPVLAGEIGPFSLAGRLLDMTEIMVCCMDEPEMTHQLLEKATAFIIKYAQGFKDAGADGILLAEPAAGLLSPGFNAEFSVPYVKQVVDALQDAGFIVVYHNCGPYTVQQIGDILHTGARMYHFGNAIDLGDMKPHIPEDVLFSGNVAPADQFRNGTPESTREATEALLGKCGSCMNFIPSSGCDIPPMARFENIDAFFSAVEQYYC